MFKYNKFKTIGSWHGPANGLETTIGGESYKNDLIDEETAGEICSKLEQHGELEKVSKELRRKWKDYCKDKKAN